MADRGLILGTAGHIDHGKTALVCALTGVDTDRLPEERRRGITIELGFANLRLPPFEFSIVDVPGHERFVRQMVAGASAVDLGMLVVAADDSVMPQTREHLDILGLLQVRSGVIAISKADLVSEDWLQLVEDEVRDLVHGTFLESAPIVPVSVVSGRGLERLKDVIVATAAGILQRERSQGAAAPDSPFRMAIDRVFPREGHGTVVTGSITHGAIATGDAVTVEPGGRTVRVRSLQCHGRACDRLVVGHRAAINVAGVHHDEIARGNVLAEPGRLHASRRFGVLVEALADAGAPLKDRASLKVLLGTTEHRGQLRLLESSMLEPGASGIAQIFLDEPDVGIWGQRFVLRAESPTRTIGGGCILDPVARRCRARDTTRVVALGRMRSEDPKVRVAAAILLRDWQPWTADRLWQLAGVSCPDAILQELFDDGILTTSSADRGNATLTHTALLDELAGAIAAALGRCHGREPLRLVFSRNEWDAGFRKLPPASLDAALERLRSTSRIRVAARGIGLSDHGPRLSQGEHRMLEKLVERIRMAGASPPFVKELIESEARHRDAIRNLLGIAVQQGDLIEIDSEFYLHRTPWGEILDRLRATFEGEGPLAVSRIKEVVGVSRKHAVPLCEYLDRAGVTRREGDLRMWVADEGRS